MLNYGNLSDYEFELLCRDIMESKLNRKLRTFSPGRDGGVDITESELSNDVIVQVKHYVHSSFQNLLSSLKKEISKVEEKKPNHYYVCCAKELTLENIESIYALFETYMDGKEAVIDLGEIDKFLHEKENASILERHYKLWLDSTGVLEKSVMMIFL